MHRRHEVRVRIALTGFLLCIASVVSAAGGETAESPATDRQTGTPASTKDEVAPVRVKPKPAAAAPKPSEDRDAGSSPSRGVAIEPVRREEPDVGVGGLSHESEKRPDGSK